MKNGGSVVVKIIVLPLIMVDKIHREVTSQLHTPACI
jgi:hypothetical protein